MKESLRKYAELSSIQDEDSSEDKEDQMDAETNHCLTRSSMPKRSASPMTRMKNSCIKYQESLTIFQVGKSQQRP
ncbi:hypothetical protein Lser_V15G24064 [Lactuca serriola]